MATLAVPQDINVVVDKAQQAIDAAIETITATQTTQSVLHENIRNTDVKIGVHNKSRDAHPDIRSQLTDIPFVITNPVIEGPNAVRTGVEGVWTFTATPLSEDITINKFIVEFPGGSETIPATGNSVTWRHTFTSDKSEVISFFVRANGINNTSGNPVGSGATDVLVTIAMYTPIDVTNMTLSFPDVISSGKTYTGQISGISDPDEMLQKIDITYNDPKITITPDKNVTQNSDITLTVVPDENGPARIRVTATVTDKKNLPISKDYTLTLNTWPLAGDWTHTVPNYLTANATATCRVSGVIDPDGTSENITFTVASSIPQITFSKAEGLKQNEDFNIIVGEIAAGTEYELTFVFTDEAGGSTTSKISSTINHAPDISGFKCIKPDLIGVNIQTDISFTGMTDSEGEALTYAIRNTNPMLKFSKTSGIADKEVVKLTATGTAERGHTYQITVIGTDASGASSEVTVDIKINTLPDSSVVADVFPTRVLPGSSGSYKFTKDTDADGTQLTYTVTSKQAGVIISDATDIHAGHEFHLTAPTAEQLARGSTFLVHVVVSDGCEKIEQDVTIKQNSLPSAANVETTLPESIPGGANNGTNFNISGGSDPDAIKFTYSITSIPPQLHFSKTEGITNADTIKVTGDATEENIQLSFKIAVVDDLGEISEDSKMVNVTLTPKYIIATPSILAPVNGASVPNEGFTMTWTAAAISVEK